MTWRRPDQTTSNIARYGFHDSTTFAASSTPTGRSFATSSASPSVITRSGSNDARASRPPIMGMLPIGLARISPSPRKASATATTQISALVASIMLDSQPDGLAVLVVAADVEIAGAERVPCVVVARGRGVLTLKRLVALVVGRAGREVRAERGLDHAVDHEAVDPQRLHGTPAGEVVRRQHLLDRHEPAFGGHAEQVVEVRVDSEVLAVAAGVAAVHVHERDVEVERGHRNQLLALAVGASVRRLDRAQLGIEAEHVRSEAGARRQERHAPRGGLEPEEGHPLVGLARLDPTPLANGA